MGVLKTGLLLAGLTAFFLAIGYLVGGAGGMAIAFGIALLTNAFAYWNADKVVLRMYNAREVDARTAPEFYGIVQSLAARAKLPMPKVYIIENDQPNAFATGRNPEHAAVAATTGLLRLLDRREIAGVMAHELTHVQNRDTLTMTVTATIAGAIGMLANFAFLFGRGSDNRSNPLGLVGTLAVAVLAPLAAMVIQMAISRTREYVADRGGAEISGDPLSLASALHKLQYGAERVGNEQAERNPATAHLFIVNPLQGRSLDNLFSTHPNMDNRIARLQAMPIDPRSGTWDSGARSGTWDSGAPPAPPTVSGQGGRRVGPWG